MLPSFFFSNFGKLRITNVSITFLLTCLESTKSIFTCWKYLQFWYFQVPPYIAHIHIVHKENRGCSCWAWILLFCSVSLFCPYIFSWEMNFFCYFWILCNCRGVVHFLCTQVAYESWQQEELKRKTSAFEQNNKKDAI